MPAYAFTIFTGAFLLFQIQPLIGKYILPWFGGGPGVWTVCLLFFQVFLLGGYAYAHWASRLPARRQVLLHLVLVLAAVLLPVVPAQTWKPRDPSHPALHILGLLTVTIGAPYFVLASTSPLLQQWFARTNPGRSPYRLYALSNAGSLLALVSYPFFFEPRLNRHAQARLWGWGLVLYALGCVWCAASVWQTARVAAQSASNAEVIARSEGPGSNPSLIERMLWVLLPACASVLLLAITNKLCQDVAVVPFLWVLPLALYLLTFIICFDHSRWYARFPFALALVAAAGGLCWALFHAGDLQVWKQLLFYSAGLFVCCMVCHGELYRLRPEPRLLTGYYLLIAAGGALGGSFVAVLAPLIFNDYYELHWGLAGCVLLFTCLCIRDAIRARGEASHEKPKHVEKASSRWRAVLRSSLSAPGEWNWLGATLPLLAFWGLDRFVAGFGQESGQAPNRTFIILRAAVWGLLVVLIISWVARGKLKQFKHWPWLACGWMVFGTCGLGIALWMQALKSGGGVVYMSRNFYGVLTVYEREVQTPKDHYFLLRHGRITHGIQFVDPAEAPWPTAYYGEDSGIGLAMQTLPPGGVRIGLVGLGVGTLTTYSRPDDVVRIYEINPEVEKVARMRFTYLNQCAGRVEVVPGDARLSLEREPSQEFDLLALDAFNSDSIPVHLLTREAFEVYNRHLKPHGILALHISNHYLDLEPVVAGLAKTFNFQSARIEYDEMPDEWWLYPSTWVLLTRDPKWLSSLEVAVATSPPSTNSPAIPLWTDDYASLFRILKTK